MLNVIEVSHRLALTLLAVAAVVIAGCNRNAPTAAPVAKGPAAHEVVPEEPPQSPTPPAAVSDELPELGSLPEFQLIDQSGREFGSSQLTDKIAIINFAFTRCKATCPAQTAALGEVQREFQADPRWSDMYLLTISVDPEHDTVDVLKQYADSADADHARWAFLTGTREEIWALSKDGFKLGVGEAPPEADSPLFHSPNFVLVDHKGKIRGYYDATNAEQLNNLSRDINRLLDAHTYIHQRPEDAINPTWMRQRAEDQLATVDRLTVFHDFRFVDRFPDSKITFTNRIVDDLLKYIRGVHYDHGTGIAVADVDGDGLHDIYFVNQVGSNQLWRNLGDGTFEDISGKSPSIALKEPVGVSASFADTDNDGDPDLVATTVKKGTFLFENNGKGEFTDITQASGINCVAHSSGIVVFDYDRDGLLDLFVTNVGAYTNDVVKPVTNDSTTRGLEEGDFEYYEGFLDAFAGHLKPEREEQSVLYRNLGEHRFEDVTEASGLTDKSWSGDATALDLNEDGWQDVYVLNMQGHDEYYENDQQGHFVKKSREIFPKTPWGAMGVKSFDYNNDGKMDLFLTDMHSDMSEDVAVDAEKAKSNMRWPESLLQTKGQSIFGNALFENTGDGKFVERSDELGLENYWPWGVSTGDLNADGFEDVFISSSMNYPYRYGVNSLLLNNQGESFVDSEFILGIEPRRDGRAAKAWFELDAEKDAAHLYVRQAIEAGHSPERVVVWGPLGTRSSVLFDLDNDGDLDIVTNECNDVPMVLISDLAEQQELAFLKINLVGGKSNRSGLGAKVAVTAGDKTYTKVQDGKSGYLSQSLLPLYFGLGEATAVDRIEVHWPSGDVAITEGPVEINQLVELREE